MIVPQKAYSRNASCALNLISTFLLKSTREVLKVLGACYSPNVLPTIVNEVRLSICIGNMNCLNAYIAQNHVDLV
jgi:hypothetical protein